MLKIVAYGLFALVACGGSNVVVNQQTATAVTSSEMHTANAVAAFATSTPPSNAQSMGMMSSPQAGATTIPITNVEVFAFTANVDDKIGDETLYWAATADMVYVWGDTDIECVDDNGSPTGETGTAEFVYAADSSGEYGWMTADGACGYSTYFGCSGDDSGESCGGCDWNDDFVACVALSS